MSTQDDVRRIATALPGVIESRTDFAFSVEVKGKAKGFAWVWKERVDPKKARVPQPAVLAVRVADQTEKAALLAGDPDKFFTEPHYHGFPAVLVRLASVSEPELRRVLVEGWRCMAARELVAAYDAEDEPTLAATPVAKRTAAAARPAASPRRKTSATARKGTRRAR